MSTRPEYEKIIHSFSEIGGNRGQVEHWSAPNRYRAIYDLLTLPLFRFPKDLEPARHRLLQSAEILKIQDCTAGSGQAIIALSQALRAKGLKVEATASDLVDPQTIVFPTYSEEFRQHIQHSYSFDATNAPRPGVHYDLSILGYLHPYVSREEFLTAIQNRLAESSVVAIIPAGDKPLSAQSSQFIYEGINGEIFSTLYDPAKERRR